VFKGNILVSFAVGLGIVIVGSALIPLASRSARPAAKGLVKGCLKLYGLGKEKTIGMGETVADIVAEAKSEVKEEARPEDHPFGLVPELPV
jgi:hypothetical protein